MVKNEAGDRKTLKLKLIQAKKKAHEKIVMVALGDEKWEDKTMSNMGGEAEC